MEIPKLIILLGCIYFNVASEHYQTIPVEGYETELQELGEQVIIPETPVKLVKITKTVAVKIPVPYPVKVIEKVPYPVHINKPYPVPVPQIVKVPVHKSQHQSHGAGNGDIHPIHPLGSNEPYKVQEHSHDSPGEDSYPPLQENQSYGYNAPQNFGPVSDEYSSVGQGDPYDSPYNSYHGYRDGSQGDGSIETKSYDKAIKDYLKIHQPNWNNGGESGHSFN